MTSPNACELIIAIDGYSACGKSTLAKDLAKELNYIHVDTGAMYRSIALYLLDKQVDYRSVESLDAYLNDIDIQFQLQEGKKHVLLNGNDVTRKIRRPEVNEIVSEVAALPMVREHLLSIQRSYGNQGGIIMDGRDIGTVIFPNADLKLFVEADIDVRAERRRIELSEVGILESFYDIKSNLIDRDVYDSNRKIAPLKRAPDAVPIDTSHHTRSSQLRYVLELIDQVKK